MREAHFEENQKLPDLLCKGGDPMSGNYTPQRNPYMPMLSQNNLETLN